jgi:TPR repeat protein
LVAVAPLAPPPAPPKAAEPDLIKQAEEASKRGNDAEAMALYRKAANAGIAEGQYRLGEIYAAGRGVTQNNSQAYIWLSLAANAGHAGAKARRDQVAKALQPAEIQQADRVIRERLKATVQRKG